jgi:hypothetical protein
MVWSRLVWLRIGTCGELLWIRWWNFGFHKCWKTIEWPHNLNLRFILNLLASDFRKYICHFSKRLLPIQTCWNQKLPNYRISFASFQIWRGQETKVQKSIDSGWIFLSPIDHELRLQSYRYRSFVPDALSSASQSQLSFWLRVRSKVKLNTYRNANCNFLCVPNLRFIE